MLSNEVLDDLNDILTAALVDDHANAFYPYRTLPAELDTTVHLTVMGGLPIGGVLGGQDRYLDFAAVLLVKHDNTAAGLEAAERALNDVEDVIWATLEANKNQSGALWLNITAETPSRRPPMPEELKRFRYGEMFFRVHLR